jgi:hypothetical protein
MQPVEICFLGSFNNDCQNKTNTIGEKTPKIAFLNISATQIF